MPIKTNRRYQMYQALKLLAVSALLLITANPAAAADDAKLSVLHGVPGLTVDVYVNGSLQLDNFTPGTLAGPLSLPAGTYSVALTASDAVDDSSPILGPIDLPLAAGMNYTAAAHLDATGNATPSFFTNDTAEASAGEGKLTVRHIAANAEGVEVVANSSTSLGTFNNGEELGPFALPAGTYSAEIKAGGVAVPPTPTDVPVTTGENIIVYAWGNAARGSVNLALQTVVLEAAPGSGPTATPIPTLGTLSLVALIMLMVGVGALSLRRFT